MKRLGYWILVCAVLLAGCSGTSQQQVETSTQQVKNKRTPPKKTATYQFDNGRVCEYRLDDPRASEYYARVAHAHGKVLIGPDGQPVSLGLTDQDESQSANESSSVMEPEKHLDPVAAGKECEKHSQCPPGYACIVSSWLDEDGNTQDPVYVCTNMIKLSCSKDLDCPDYEKCDSGRCVMCKTNSDCRYGYTCSAGSCVPKDAKPNCKTAGDCKNGETCVFGECAAFCDSSTPCKGDKACQGLTGVGLCLSTHSELYSELDIAECLTNDDLPYDKSCYQMDSQRACEVWDVFYDQMFDRRCDKEFCVNGACVECLKDDDCSDGLRCIDNSCGCLSNSDCKSGLYCSRTHWCVPCRNASECTAPLKCGYPPEWKARGMNKPVSLAQCLECTRNEDCSTDRPMCNKNGQCVAAECATNLDCCYSEQCLGGKCAEETIRYQPGETIEEFKKYVLQGFDENIEAKESFTLCKTNDACNFDEACNQKLHYCKKVRDGQKVAPKELEYYKTLGTQFCWRDSECQPGEVCNDRGICGCSRDSCGEGYECSADFGCLPKDPKICGDLVYKNFKCLCTEDSQCGSQKFCASNGVCQSLNDADALFLEGLRWSTTYHGRKYDVVKSIKYLEKAIKLNHKDALLEMVEKYNDFYTNNEAYYDEPKHLNYLKKLESLKTPEGLLLISYHFDDMSYTEPDLTEKQEKAYRNKSIAYLHKAADAGSSEAIGRLVSFYMDGTIRLRSERAQIGRIEKYLNLYFKYVPGKLRSVSYDDDMRKALDTLRMYKEELASTSKDDDDDE